MKKNNLLYRYVIVLVVVFSMVATTGALADSSRYRNYVRAGLGANLPTGDLDDAGYDAGVAFDVAYGRYLAKHLVIEGGFHSFVSDGDSNGSNAVAGDYTREDNVFVSSILGTLKGVLPVGIAKLYAGGGVGLYAVSLESEIETSRLGEFDVDESDSVFGAHIVVGGNFDITHRVFVGIEGMYRWTTDFDLNESVVTIPVDLEGDLDGYAIMVRGGFRF